MNDDFMFSSESVTEGHPDKLCDQISDAIVDRFLQHDPAARVSAECAAAHALIFIAARFASTVTVDLPAVARQVIDLAGYHDESLNSKTCSIVTSLQELPFSDRILPDRELTDDEIERVAVRQEASVFGFACRQTPALMPLPIWLAHRLARRLSSTRMQNIVPGLAPDGKTRVGVEFRNRVPYRIHSLTVIASEEAGGTRSRDSLQKDLRDAVIAHTFSEEPIKPDDKTRVFINPEGPLLVGGPTVHAGLTGRKCAADLYGEYSRQSVSALSGKDPFRIDRVGVYAARHAAKNVVAAALAEECEVLLSYSIGGCRPVSVQVETFGTGKIPDARIAALVAKHFELRIAGIVQQFNLKRLPATVKGGFYRKLAVYGQVGRMDMGLPWEVTDKAQLLREEAGVRGESPHNY